MIIIQAVGLSYLSDGCSTTELLESSIVRLNTVIKGYEDQLMLDPINHKFVHCRSPKKNTYKDTQLSHHTIEIDP